ncbi:MAG: hypothetical protein C0412_20965 [Flavobacterium sp.]|nr:hypothetical protein [Flavobacterium sp.]
MISIPFEDIFLGFMVTMRIFGLILMVPFFTSRSISAYLRTALVIGLGVLLYPLVKWSGSFPHHQLEWILCLGKELVAGLIMGMAVKMVFFIVEFSGNLIMEESGLARNDSFDPINSTKTSTLSILLFYLSTLMCFILQVDHDMFLALVKSYDYVPVGVTKAGLGGVDMLLKGSADVFFISVKMAAPVIAINFTVMMTFSIMSKAAPKIDLFSTSFAVRIVVGSTMLILSFGLIAQYLFREIKEIPEYMLKYLVNY